MFDIELRSANAPIAYLDGFVPPVGRDPPATAARLALTDPALQVITLFWEQPVTVIETRSIDDALAEMMRTGVRALFVVRDALVIGLITSYDIYGERPLQFLANSGYSRHDEIEVSHIMTPWEHVPTLDWHALGRARISDLVAHFGKTSATHLVVVKHGDGTESFARGLLSQARLARQLEHPI